MTIARHWRPYAAATLAAVIAVATATPAVVAQTPAVVAQTPAFARPDSITEGAVTVNGQAIEYRAVAGTLTVGATDPQDATLGLDGQLLPDAGEKAPDAAKPEAGDAPPEEKKEDPKDE